jgi:hypothetical protein
MGEHDVPELPAAAPYRYAEQMDPPTPQPVTDVARTTFPHVFEVDPRLMTLFVLQQEFPNWDTLRIMRSRGDHLAWMHRHWCTTVVSGEELRAEVEADPEAGA